MYVRFQPGGGAQTVSLGQAGAARPAVRQQRRRPARQPAVLSRQAPAVPARRRLPHAAAARPQRPGRRQDAPHRDRDPDADAMKTAIRKHFSDFLAIIGLIVVAGAGLAR